MKTSNKLLLGFIIAVFLLPVCTFFVLKGMVKKGKYTVRHYTMDGYISYTGRPYALDGYRSGSIGEYKAIKIIGATDHVMNNGGLICVIHHSDSASYYKYYFHNDAYDDVTVKDSISLGVVGDTLIVQRLIVTPKDTACQYHTSIQKNVDLYLSSYPNISVSNAIVQLDSNGTENLSVNLKDNASLVFGAATKNMAYPENPLQYGSRPIVYKNIHIASSKSSIRLNSNTLIDSLYLDMNGTSDLSIPDSVSIKSINGSIDQSTVITATSGIYKRLIPLVR